MEISLFLSVLGVVLTVVFFVVGYRQTIGARRERARSANQALVDTFFRRLALEENFALTRSDVVKIISGWAISSRVRSTDIHSLQQLEDLLSARVLESDYISEVQRQAIGSRISRIFSEEKNTVFIGKDSADSSKIRPEVLLAIGSAMASLAAGIFTTLFIPESSDIAARTLFQSAIIPTALIALTASVLLVYTQVRDISRPSNNDPASVRADGAELERAFFLAARRRNKSFRPSSEPNFDFMYDDENGVVGIEVKRDINRLSRQHLNKIIDQMNSSVEKGLISRGVIVTSVKPSERAISLSTTNVSIAYIPEFLSGLLKGGPSELDGSL